MNRAALSLVLIICLFIVDISSAIQCSYVSYVRTADEGSPSCDDDYIMKEYWLHRSLSSRSLCNDEDRSSWSAYEEWIVQHRIHEDQIHQLHESAGSITSLSEEFLQCTKSLLDSEHAPLSSTDKHSLFEDVSIHRHLFPPYLPTESSICVERWKDLEFEDPYRRFIAYIPEIPPSVACKYYSDPQFAGCKPHAMQDARIIGLKYTPPIEVDFEETRLFSIPRMYSCNRTASNTMLSSHRHGNIGMGSIHMDRSGWKWVTLGPFNAHILSLSNFYILQNNRFISLLCDIDFYTSTTNQPISGKLTLDNGFYTPTMSTTQKRNYTEKEIVTLQKPMLGIFGSKHPVYFHDLVEDIAFFHSVSFLTEYFGDSFTIGIKGYRRLSPKLQYDIITEWLAIMGLKVEIIELDMHKIYTGPLLFLPSNTRPYIPSPGVVQLARLTIAKHIPRFYHTAKERYEAGESFCILVVQRIHTRMLLNHEEMLQAMKERFPEEEIVVFVQENQEDTAKLFNSAKVVVSPHGSGLANLIYSPQGTQLVELHVHDTDYPYELFDMSYLSLSGTLGIGYFSVVGEGSSHVSLTVDIDETMRMLALALSSFHTLNQIDPCGV